MIRVLALNDDNHDTFFMREDGIGYYDAATFIKECLAKAHYIDYEIRGIYLCDDFSDTTLATIDPVEIDNMFNCVCGGDDGCGYEFMAAFDTLWAGSSERWH